MTGPRCKGGPQRREVTIDTQPHNPYPKPVIIDEPRERPNAEPFAAELALALAARGLKPREVAAALVPPMNPESLRRLLQGRIVPRMETAVALGEALEWESLPMVAAQLRTKVCRMCKKRFLDASPQLAGEACSEACKNRVMKRARGVAHTKELSIAQRRTGIVELAVAAFCARCEPASLCRQPTCELRPVSPLPLAVGLREVQDLDFKDAVKPLRIARMAQEDSRREYNRRWRQQSRAKNKRKPKKVTTKEVA